MKWTEFAILLAGLDDSTPLGRIIAIRSEDDPKRVKEMTIDQKRIRNEWRKRQVRKKSDAEIREMYVGLQNAIRSMAYGKG